MTDISDDPAAAPRRYSSVLRERQAAQTREMILDALIELLGERRVDEVTTRDIAASAGVSDRTVYRHFPDRDALLEGLSLRLQSPGGKNPAEGFSGVDDFAPTVIRLMTLLDEHHAAARAEAVFNADPRRFASETQTNTRQFREAITEGFPELDEREQLRIAAVVRCLISSQAWLRMREEFGVPGTEAGPVVAWVIDTIFREIRSGNAPPAPSTVRGPSVHPGVRHQE